MRKTIFQENSKNRFGILQNTTLYFILRSLVRFSIRSFILSLCCVFLHLVYPMLPISLDCPFVISPSVFSNVYSLTNVQFAIKILNLKKNYWVIQPLVSPEMLSDLFTSLNRSYSGRVNEFYDQRTCYLFNDVKPIRQCY